MKNSSLSFASPDPTPTLLVMAAACAWLYWVGDMGWVAMLPAALVLIPTAVYLLSQNISLALAAILGSAAMPRYFAQISGIKARPEHIVTGLLCLSAVFIYKRLDNKPRWMFADLLAAAFILMNVFSSIFMSVAPSQTFKWSMQQTLVVLPYFLVRLLASNRERFHQAIKIMLVVGTVEAGYAVLCFFSYRLFGTDFGVEIGQYGDIPGIYGSQFEANLLGSYCGACLVVMLFLYFRDRSRALLWGSAITFAGLIISLSRAAVASTALVLAVLIYYSLRKGLANVQALRRVGLVFAGVGLILAASITPLYAERFSTVDLSNPTADDTTKIRVLGLGVAAERSLEHPVFGGGTNSFQLEFEYQEIGYDTDVGGWIGNPEMRVWHDTGAVGLAIFLAFLAFVFVPALRVARRTPSSELLGLLLAGLLYCISFQATDATILSFPWIHLGLIAAGNTLLSNSRPESTGLEN
ncbi:MAG TPA: O-antigen ligase family protein [Ktedonobacteraceae bacterium]|nr:O-antigen ligase family protein [Ktedonobacteraceae bacterium]